MKNTKLIILYGFASSGKTTLAKRYIDEHPLTIAIEGDQLIGMIGQWRRNETQARKLVFEHTKSIAENHLSGGHAVLIPYLLTDSTQIESFEKVAEKYGASFHEVYIKIDKEGAINRLLNRGCWGEEGSKILTEDDRTEVLSLYEHMTTEMNKRTNVKYIESEVGKIKEAYQKLLGAIQ